MRNILKVLAGVGAVFAFAVTAYAQAILLSGAGSGGSSPPSSINFTGTTIVASAPQGTFVGTLSTVGGTAPFTYTVSNSKFQISGNQVQRSGTGILTAGTPESLNFTSTDANSLSTNTATNGQGPFSVAVTSTGATLLTQATITNWGSSTQAANFVTPIFGMAFKEGDIPNGCTTGAPTFEIDGTSTPLAFSESTAPMCWPDGSLAFAAFMFIDTASIPGSNGTQTIDIFNGGTYPSASSRVPATDYANCDLNNRIVEMDGPDGNGTAYKADLRDGLSNNGSDYKYMDGGAGRVDRVRAQYKTNPGGVAQGSLEYWYYVQDLQDSVGGFGGLRWIGRLIQPYYNGSGPTQQLYSFQSFVDYDSNSPIYDPWSSQETAYAFDWGGTTCSATLYCMNVTAMPWQYGNLVRFTTTGGATLPSTLSTNTSYYIGNASTWPYRTTTFNIATVPDMNTSKYVATPATHCSITNDCFATSYPYISPFGSLYDAQNGTNTSGTPNYRQCGGSIATEQTVMVGVSPAYWVASGLIPPYNINWANAGSISPNAAYPFYPMGWGPMERGFAQTGERCDIGVMPCWAATYFFTQALTDDRVVRVVALGAGNWSVSLHDATTLALPCVNNGHGGSGSTYTGMASCTFTNFRWDPGNQQAQGFTVPLGTNDNWQAGYKNFDTSHAPNPGMACFLITGEPQCMDEVEENGDWAVYQRPGSVASAALANSTTTSIVGAGSFSNRNLSINGSLFYGCVLGSSNELRYDAWARGLEVSAAFINYPGTANYHQYFLDMAEDNVSAALAWNTFLGAFDPWVTTNGLWNEANEGNYTPWTGSYFLGAYAESQNYTNDPNNLTFLNYLAKWPKHLHDHWGFVYSSAFVVAVRQTYSPKAPFVTSDANVGFGTEALSWTPSGFSVACVGSCPSAVNIAAGDTVVLNNLTGASGTPVNFSQGTGYCVLSGPTGNWGASGGGLFQLGATCGGAAIAPGNSETNQQAYFVSPNFTTNSQKITSILNSDSYGYANLMLGSLLYANAAGASVDATTLSDIQGYINNNGSYPAAFIGSQKYLWSSTF